MTTHIKTSASMLKNCLAIAAEKFKQDIEICKGAINDDGRLAAQFVKQEKEARELVDAIDELDNDDEVLVTVPHFHLVEANNCYVEEARTARRETAKHKVTIDALSSQLLDQSPTALFQEIADWVAGREVFTIRASAHNIRKHGLLSMATDGADVNIRQQKGVDVTLTDGGHRTFQT